jgi:autotransporter-associated beta strand protein
MVTGVVWRKHPGSGDFDTATNWSTNTVPVIADNAVFGTSKITSLTFSSASTSVGHWIFLKGVSNYHFQIDTGHNVALVFSGISMKDNRVSINNQGLLEFAGTGSAAKAKIMNGSVLSFHQDATAGGAKITNDGSLSFFDTSKAGHAKILNNGTILFSSQSTADHATITTASGAATNFDINGTGGSARLIAQLGGTVDFSQSTGPDSNAEVSAGSIAGAGTFNLGATFFIVGGNNLSTIVSGAINDGGLGGGTGAILDKVGKGTLKLSHAGNTYSGVTELDAGTLDVAAVGAAGTGGIAFLGGSHAKLKIENSALSAHDFANILVGFGAGQKIDLAGLKFHKHAKATYDDASHILTVKSGHVTDTLHLLGPDPGHFKVTDDGHGGCKIVLVPEPLHPAKHQAAAGGEESFRFNSAIGSAASHEIMTADLQPGIGNHESSSPFHAEAAMDVSAIFADHNAHLLALHGALL